MSFISKIIGDKKRWRRYKARVDALPENYRIATKAIQRYSYYFGGGDAEGGMRMLEDLADLFEQAAADGTPIRDIVGENPEEFAREFFANYRSGHWIIRERDRLARDIDRAAETAADRAPDRAAETAADRAADRAAGETAGGNTGEDR